MKIIIKDLPISKNTNNLDNQILQKSSILFYHRNSENVKAAYILFEMSRYLKLLLLVLFFHQINIVHAQYNESLAFIPPNLYEPVPVAIDLYILDIFEINEPEGYFEVDAFLFVEWVDERLSFDPNEYGYDWKIYRGPILEKKFKNEIWWPDLYVVNGVGTRKVVSSGLVITSDGFLRYEERFNAKVQQDFYLDYFPFDSHSVELTIGTFNYISNEVEFSLLEGGEKNFTWGTNEWDVTDKGDAFIGYTTYPEITYTLSIKRQYGYYVSKFILPLLLIVTISWAVFWMDPEDVNIAERLGISFTSMLTVVAFDFVSSENLPKLSYPTTLDYILAASYVFLALTVVIIIINSLLVNRDRIMLSRRIDLLCRFMFPFFYYLIIVFLIYSSI